MTKRELDPIIGSFPDKDKIKCATCKYRYKTIFAEKDIGPSKGYCKIYDENTNGKPIDILFKNANCEYYEKS